MAQPGGRRGLSCYTCLQTRQQWALHSATECNGTGCPTRLVMSVSCVLVPLSLAPTPGRTSCTKAAACLRPPLHRANSLCAFRLVGAQHKTRDGPRGLRAATAGRLQVGFEHGMETTACRQPAEQVWLLAHLWAASAGHLALVQGPMSASSHKAGPIWGHGLHQGSAVCAVPWAKRHRGSRDLPLAHCKPDQGACRHHWSQAAAKGCCDDTELAACCAILLTQQHAFMSDVCILGPPACRPSLLCSCNHDQPPCTTPSNAHILQGQGI